MKKKTPSSPHSLAEKKPVNLGDKIKELEDRLFGVKWPYSLTFYTL